MNEKTAQKISQWKNYPNLDPLLRKELESLSPEALEDAFYEDLALDWGLKRCHRCWHQSDEYLYCPKNHVGILSIFG